MFAVLLVIIGMVLFMSTRKNIPRKQLIVRCNDLEVFDSFVSAFRPVRIDWDYTFKDVETGLTWTTRIKGSTVPLGDIGDMIWLTDYPNSVKYAIKAKDYDAQ